MPNLEDVDGPSPEMDAAFEPASSHRGVMVTGEQGAEGPKAFYIRVEARLGHEQQVQQMLQDILSCVRNEPETGPWFALRYSQTTFGIFEAFPSLAGRQAHVEGGGGAIFRDIQRMNEILAVPAHVFRLDVLASKSICTF